MHVSVHRMIEIRVVICADGSFSNGGYQLHLPLLIHIDLLQLVLINSWLQGEDRNKSQRDVRFVDHHTAWGSMQRTRT